MQPLEIFCLQFLLSLVLFALFAKWYLSPWLATKPTRVALALLILPHTFRHIGLTFLTPAGALPTLPMDFAVAAAYGDLLSGLLALLAVVALRGRWTGTLALVWLFNSVGTIDLFNALRQADAVPHFTASWYIPTFLVPLLLVTHAMVFIRLVKANGTRLLPVAPSP